MGIHLEKWEIVHSSRRDAVFPLVCSTEGEHCLAD